jgi:hypothetical protein
MGSPQRMITTTSPAAAVSYTMPLEHINYKQ